MKAHLIHAGEWVRTSMLSTRFDVLSAGGCEGCGRMHARALWYSIKRQVVRCDKCGLPIPVPK